MKKFLLILLAVLVVIFAAIYGILFSSIGNKHLSQYAQNYLNKELEGLVIKDFYLRPSELRLQLDYANLVDFKIQGDLKLASLGLNLDYILTSKNLELIDIKGLIKITGKVSGSYNDLSITADGQALNSPLSAAAKIIAYEPKNIRLKLDNLDLGNIAKIAKYPVVTGLASADISAQDLEHLEGKISSNFSFLPAADEMANMKLSALKKINLQIDANTDEQGILGTASLWSNALVANITDARIKGENLSCKIDANSPNISWINEILHGDLSLAAKLDKTGDNLALKGDVNGSYVGLKELMANVNLKNLSGEASANVLINSAIIGLQKSILLDSYAKILLQNSAISSAELRGIGLGGHLIAKLADNRLSASLKHASLDQALELADAPKIAKGFFDLDANVKDLQKIKAKINAQLDARTNAAYLKELSGYAVNTPIKADVNADINGIRKANLNAVMRSELVDLIKLDAKLADKAVSANYEIEANLANFSDLLQRKMSSKVALFGDAIYKDDLKLNLKSKEFLGANLDANLINEKLTATLKNAKISKFAKAFSFADIYDAVADADFNYDIHSQNGEFLATLKEGHFQPSPALKLINSLTKTQLEKIAFNDGWLRSKINATTASIDANLKAQNAEFSAVGGSYLLANSTAKVPVTLSLGGSTIKGLALLDEKGEFSYKPDAKNATENVLKLLGKQAVKKSANADAAASSAPSTAPDLSSKEGRKDAAKKLLKSIFK